MLRCQSLDTSLSYSIISRDTLIAFGYPVLHVLASMPLAMVTLSIRDLQKMYLFAKYLFFGGLAGRSAAKPSTHYYCETLSPGRHWKDVPRAITPQQNLGVKLMLPQPVRALFGVTRNGT